MDREIALRRLQFRFELVEVRHVGIGEIGHDPQPQAAVDDIVDPSDVECRHALHTPRTALRIIAQPGSAMHSHSPSPANRMK